jgi:flagella basal body P-ring formation protein FlgA
MSVVAQQDAMIGDVINLKNPKTNNLLTGQVTGFGEVELR